MQAKQQQQQQHWRIKLFACISRRNGDTTHTKQVGKQGHSVLLHIGVALLLLLLRG